jgi:hypothetical protein
MGLQGLLHLLKSQLLKKAGEKRQLKRKAPEDDPFIDDTPPTPSLTPKQHLATRKTPPVLNEGPYRNVYVQT